jgi:hypothetical protein
MPEYAGKTLAEILKTKKARIKNAPLEHGSPSWDDIMDLTWEELVRRKKRGDPGFKTFHKLLKAKRFNKK